MLGVREKATGSKKPNATARCFCCNNNNSTAKNHRPAEFISNSTVIRLFYYWAMWAIQTRATIGAELTLVAHQRATFLFSSQSSVSSALLHSLLISHCIHFCSLSAFCDHVGVRRTLPSESALCINKPIILGEIIFTVKMKSMEFHRSKERRVENFTSQRLPSLDDPVVYDEKRSMSTWFFLLFHYDSVPPQKIRIIEDNRQVSSVIGPYDEGDQLSLNCIVTGGNPVGSLIGCFR